MVHCELLAQCLANELHTATAIVGFGGKPLTQEMIIAALREKDITSGIQRKGIEALVEHTNEAPPGAEMSVTVAKGKHPINGSNARFKPLADDARKRLIDLVKVRNHHMGTLYGLEV